MNGALPLRYVSITVIYVGALTGMSGTRWGMREARNTSDKGTPQLWFAWYPVRADKGRRWLTCVWWHHEYAYNNTRGRGLSTVAVNRYRAL